jgi:hypothetical protein
MQASSDIYGTSIIMAQMHDSCNKESPTSPNFVNLGVWGVGGHMRSILAGYFPANTPTF